jgi:hypothetical protein
LFACFIGHAQSSSQIRRRQQCLFLIRHRGESRAPSWDVGLSGFAALLASSAECSIHFVG